MFLRLWKQWRDKDALLQAKAYVDSALQYMSGARASACSFQVGAAGTYAVAAIVYDQLGQAEQSAQYVQQVLAHLQQWNGTHAGRLAKPLVNDVEGQC